MGDQKVNKFETEDLVTGVFMLLLLAGIVFGVYEAFHFLYEVARGTYHLLDKLIDKI